MKRRLLLWVGVIEALIVLAVAYFEPTHCVRGKLWGEAFFDGRPTSYWRRQIDGWIACHGSAEAVQRGRWNYRYYADGPVDVAGYQLGSNGTMTFSAAFLGNEDDEAELTIEFAGRPTAWENLRSFWNRQEPRQGSELPKILSGLHEGEAVWRELEMDACYRPFVQRTRRAFDLIQGMKTDAWVAGQAE